jgi:hypothetical protein
MRNDYLPATAATTTVATAAAARATAAAATTVAAATTAAAAATTAGAGLVLRLIDAQCATAEILAVYSLDGTSGIRLAHLDEAETAWAAGLAVIGEGNRLYGAVCSKQRTDVVFSCGERQVAYINLGHVTLLSDEQWIKKQ